MLGIFFTTTKSKIIAILIAVVVTFAGLFLFFYQKNAQKNDIGAGSKIPDFAVSMQIPETSFPERICDIADYGATNDGKTLNTQAFKNTIESCASQGGGTVLVPAGRWLTGPINLKNNINLHLEKDAEILFSTNFDDYLPVVFSRYEGIEYYNYSPPIYTKDAKNVAITGEGILNGQAELSWWDSKKFPADKKNIMLYRMGKKQASMEERTFGKPDDGFRPTFVEFINCERILIDGITLIDGPMWTIHPLYSQNIIIKNIKVETENGDSADGIAIDSSQNVLIENCDFATGDDAVAIKSGRDADGLRVNRPSENIIIKNCRARSAHAAIAIGSEVSGGIRNIFVENFSAENVEYGIRIKSGIERSGFVENVQLQNINIKNAGISAVEIDQIYGEGTKLDNNLDINPSRMNNIRLIDITAEKSENPIIISGYKDLPITQIVFSNIRIKSKKRVLISNASAVTFDNLLIESKEINPAVDIKGCRDVKFINLKLPKKQIRCENCQFD